MSSNKNYLANYKMSRVGSTYKKNMSQQAPVYKYGCQTDFSHSSILATVTTQHEDETGQHINKVTINILRDQAS